MRSTSFLTSLPDSLTWMAVAAVSFGALGCAGDDAGTGADDATISTGPDASNTAPMGSTTLTPNGNPPAEPPGATPPQPAAVDTPGQTPPATAPPEPTITGPGITPPAPPSPVEPVGGGGNGGSPGPIGDGGNTMTPVNPGGGAAPVDPVGGGAGDGGAAGAAGGNSGAPGGGGIWDFVEDPGEGCAVGAMPSLDSLTANAKLPDPFTKMDGTPMTDKSEWVCRREEILQLGYEFIYGPKPRTPKDAVTGSVSENMISVEVNDGGSTSFTVTVTLPSSGSAPYPAVIGFGGIGFSSELASRGIASINYNAYTVGDENGGSGPKEGAFYDVYGSDHKAGLLVAWAWGISRVLDVLEQDPSVIDPTKIGVTGCSRFGKGAFVVGVLDNRIALTVPVESGVGGTPALRLIGDLDSGGEWPFHAISYERWFSAENLGQFATANNANGDTTDRLPVDIHEMIGLVAPRGLYIVDNPSSNYAGLDRNTAWVTANAGAKIYEALGVGDNITLEAASGAHCSWRSQYTAPLVANLEKFLLGDDSAATGSFNTDGNPPSPEDHYDWSVPTLAGDL
jgi:hypothetical protein